MYNQKTTTEIKTCSSLGTEYCEQWETETTTTYNYFDLILYSLYIIIPILLYKLFKK